MKNNRPRKGKGSNSRPVSFSANSNCTTKKLLAAIREKQFTEFADILESHGVVGEFSLIVIGLLDLSVRGEV